MSNTVLFIADIANQNELNENERKKNVCMLSGASDYSKSHISTEMHKHSKLRFQCAYTLNDPHVRCRRRCRHRRRNNNNINNAIYQ